MDRIMSASASSSDTTSGAPPPKTRWGIAGALAAVFVVGVVLHLLGVVRIEPDAIVGWLRDAGPWGALLLVATFAIGTLANVPGLVFIAAAVTLYGPAGGYFVALLGAIAAVNLTFALGRATNLGTRRVLERPLVARLTRMLDERPILTLTLLRAIVLVSPPINYALALTRMRHRDYAIGSALGLVLPTLVVTQGLSCLIS
jgi:uncharacterized membrane protein YdjX (TVP38/TMEM64 family)